MMAISLLLLVGGGVLLLLVVFIALGIYMQGRNR